MRLLLRLHIIQKRPDRQQAKPRLRTQQAPLIRPESLQGRLHAGDEACADTVVGQDQGPEPGCADDAEGADGDEAGEEEGEGVGVGGVGWFGVGCGCGCGFVLAGGCSRGLGA